ncbi:MAG: hypothetical protein AAGA32_20180 [Pseudomonadota bacterium]
MVTLETVVMSLVRVAHALKMGLLVAGVAVGAVGLFYVANRPDDAPAQALLSALMTGDLPVRDVAPADWTHVCFGALGEDVRVRMQVETGHSAKICTGDNAWTALYDTYAELGFASPTACRVVPVHRDLFRPALTEDTARCVARSGFMLLSLTVEDGQRTLQVSGY